MSQIGQWTTRSYLNEDQRWIGPGGLEDMHIAQSITLVKNEFDFVTAFPNSYLPSGIVLAKLTGGANVGKYGKYVSAGANGLATPVGFLMVSVEVSAAAPAGQLVQAALYWRGQILESMLPTGHGLDAGAKTALAAKFSFI